MASASDDLAIHRAVYRDAHSRGDPLATARAAARLRAHITHLDANELTAVRASRQRFGQAIREARSRRLAPPAPLVQVHGIPLSPPRRFPVALAAAFALLALVLEAVVGEPLLVGPTEGGGGAPAADAPDPFVQPITAQSRGRVVLAVATVPRLDVPEATTVSEPVTVIASPAALASSGPAAAPGVSGGAPGGTNPAGSGAPGPGTGGSGGNGSAAPSATRVPTPTPKPTPLPPLAPGFARLSGVVIDASTGRGLPGACVSLGPCTVGAPITDASGRWTLDLPVGSGRLDWGLEFAKPGYTLETLLVRSRTGYIFLPAEQLSPTG